MQVAPRMLQTAAISATQAPIALTAVASMATGSEGAEAGAGENAAAGEVERPAGWDLWSRQKKIDFRKRHNNVLGPTSGAGVSR